MALYKDTRCLVLIIENQVWLPIHTVVINVNEPFAGFG